MSSVSLNPCLRDNILCHAATNSQQLSGVNQHDQNLFETTLGSEATEPLLNDSNRGKTLLALAQDESRWKDLMSQAFGDDYDIKGAEQLRQQVLGSATTDDWSWLPRANTVEGLSGQGVTGAFHDDGNGGEILLDSGLDNSQREAVFFEELGHAFDAFLRPDGDAKGDEGALFSRFLSDSEGFESFAKTAEYKLMSTEDDRTTIEVNRNGQLQSLQVEASDFEDQPFYQLDILDVIDNPGDMKIPAWNEALEFRLSFGNGENKTLKEYFRDGNNGADFLNQFTNAEIRALSPRLLSNIPLDQMLNTRGDERGPAAWGTIIKPGLHDGDVALSPWHSNEKHIDPFYDVQGTMIEELTSGGMEQGGPNFEANIPGEYDLLDLMTEAPEAAEEAIEAVGENRFLKGMYDSTIGGVVTMVKHPIQTLKGLGQLLAALGEFETDPLAEDLTLTNNHDRADQLFGGMYDAAIKDINDDPEHAAGFVFGALLTLGAGELAGAGEAGAVAGGVEAIDESELLTLADEAGIELHPLVADELTPFIDVTTDAEALEKFGVPVVFDAEAAGGADGVKVLYDVAEDGSFDDIHLAIGPNAKVADVTIHEPIIDLLRNREPGVAITLEAEAQLEMSKLSTRVEEIQKIIENDSTLTDVQRLTLEAKSDEYSSYLHNYQTVLYDGETNAEGFVATPATRGVKRNYGDMLGSDGAGFARALGYPDAPSGYRWINDSDTNVPIIRRFDSKSNLPELVYDEQSNSLVDVDPNLVKAQFVQDASGKPIYDEISLGRPLTEKMQDQLTKREAAIVQRDALLDEKMKFGLSDVKTQQLKDAYSDINEASRLIGEGAADISVGAQYPGAKLVYGGPDAASAAGDFDQVWEYTDGAGINRYVVVEAKGGSSTLGDRLAGTVRAQQGTSDYFSSILNEMDKNPANKSLMNDLRDAFNENPKRVEYVLTETPIHGAGNNTYISSVKQYAFDMA